MFLLVTLPPRLRARLLFCFSRRRHRRGRAAAVGGDLRLGISFPVGFGVDLRGIRRGDVPVTRWSPRVGLVEAAALENDADRVEDARYWRATFGALGQWRVGDSLLHLEMVAAAAPISIDGHFDLTYTRIVGGRKRRARARLQLIQSLLFGLGSSDVGSLKSPGCSNPLCIISATRSKKASSGLAASTAAARGSSARNRWTAAQMISL